MNPVYHHIDSKTSEAARLRELGYYDAALAAFDTIRNAPLFELEAAGMLLEQGLVRDCISRLQRLRSSPYSQYLMENTCGLFPLLESLTHAAASGRFSEAMPTVNYVYHRFLLPLLSGTSTAGQVPERQIVRHASVLPDSCPLLRS